MPLLDHIRTQLIRDEGIRLSPYRCTAGRLTIGIGHNLGAKPISRRAALTILDDDITDTLAELDAKIPWFSTLDEARQGALANMAFNLGVGGVLKFKRMLTALRNGAYKVAAEEVQDSLYRQQVGERALRVAEQIRTGTWQ